MELVAAGKTEDVAAAVHGGVGEGEGLGHCGLQSQEGGVGGKACVRGAEVSGVDGYHGLEKGAGVSFGWDDFER